jgi:hypothetical protein
MQCQVRRVAFRNHVLLLVLIHWDPSMVDLATSFASTLTITITTTTAAVASSSYVYCSQGVSLSICKPDRCFTHSLLCCHCLALSFFLTPPPTPHPTHSTHTHTHTTRCTFRIRRLGRTRAQPHSIPCCGTTPPSCCTRAIQTGGQHRSTPACCGPRFRRRVGGAPVGWAQRRPLHVLCGHARFLLLGTAADCIAAITRRRVLRRGLGGDWW